MANTIGFVTNALYYTNAFQIFGNESTANTAFMSQGYAFIMNGPYTVAAGGSSFEPITYPGINGSIPRFTGGKSSQWTFHGYVLGSSEVALNLGRQVLSGFKSIPTTWTISLYDDETVIVPSGYINDVKNTGQNGLRWFLDIMVTDSQGQF